MRVIPCRAACLAESVSLSETTWCPSNNRCHLLMHLCAECLTHASIFPFLGSVSPCHGGWWHPPLTHQATVAYRNTGPCPTSPSQQILGQGWKSSAVKTQAQPLALGHPSVLPPLAGSGGQQGSEAGLMVAPSVPFKSPVRFSSQALSFQGRPWGNLQGFTHCIGPSRDAESL